MYTFEWTQDRERVRTVMTHPAIYDGIRDDSAPRAELFKPDLGGRFLYLSVRDDDDLLGLFVFEPRNEVCWEVHTCLLPHCRGVRALAVYRAGMEWVRRETTCRKILGNIQPENRGALWVAKRAGLNEIGVNTKSILRQGELRDQIILGKEL
jgi:RimJ/RimL family protein N-acetyltransferase